MHDEILKSHFRDFAEQNALESRPESEQFERFANYCIISKQYPREFDFEDLSVEGGTDTDYSRHCVPLLRSSIAQQQCVSTRTWNSEFIYRGPIRSSR